MFILQSSVLKNCSLFYSILKNMFLFFVWLGLEASQRCGGAGTACAVIKGKVWWRRSAVRRRRRRMRKKEGLCGREEEKEAARGEEERTGG